MPELLGGAAADYLKSLKGKERELLARLFYLVMVVTIQNPAVRQSEMIYAIHYGMARYFLDHGQSPETAWAALAKVPWDILPGMNERAREIAEKLAVEAFADASAGHPPASYFC
jgi:hypothetical protein